ncbi:MAG: GlxA family transcriptional regulator [Pseudomonadota bacterium]
MSKTILFKPMADSAPDRVSILLLPSFSMMPFSGMIETMRLANMLSKKNLYQWELISLDGNCVTASSKLKIECQYSIDEVPEPTNIVVCAGLNAHEYRDQAVFSWLRKWASCGAHIGAVCTGALILARAGLLKDYSCTLHWSAIDSFIEEFSDHQIQSGLFQVDRNRFTCAGGIASIDMFLYEITVHHGNNLGMQISDQLMHEQVRKGHDNQRIPLRTRLRISHPKLISAIEEMEKNQEFVLSRDEIAKRVGVSRRQLERLFLRYLNISPARYYLKLRLSRARTLLAQTTMPVTEVAFACGFTSASHFSKCYRDMYNHAPRIGRRIDDGLIVFNDAKKIC